MRWSTGPKVGEVRGWHSYFAWYPVKINDHMVWLERVERKRERKWFSDGTPYCQWPGWKNYYRHLA